MKTLFANRREAGQSLAALMTRHAQEENALVLALPRGGVPVAYEVARRLELPLEVFLVRKLGLPGHEELAMGAVASGGIRFLNHDVIDHYGIPASTVDAVERRELRVLAERERLYHDDRSALDVRGKTVIVIDDGLATGSSMKAAVGALRQKGARHVIVAVPVAPRETFREFQLLADEIVVLETPDPFHGVGLWYEDFSQTSDEEVRELLAAAASRPVAAA